MVVSSWGNLIPMGTQLNKAHPEPNKRWISMYLLPLFQEILENVCELEHCEHLTFLARWAAVQGNPAAVMKSDIFLFFDGAEGAGDEEGEEKTFSDRGVLFYRQDRAGDMKRVTHRIHVPSERQTLRVACSHLWRLDGRSASAYNQIQEYLISILNESWMEIRLDLGVW